MDAVPLITGLVMESEYCCDLALHQHFGLMCIFACNKTKILQLLHRRLMNHDQQRSQYLTRHGYAFREAQNFFKHLCTQDLSLQTIFLTDSLQRKQIYKLVLVAVIVIGLLYYIGY
ncbi:hypothetical protein ACOSQ2_014875 [Xanthoceras sorbifolium]